MDNLEKMFEYLLRKYRVEIYLNYSELRGVTFLSRILERTASRLYEKGFFSITQGKTELKFKQSKDILPVLSENVITGYIKKRDIKETDFVLDAGAYPGEFSIYAAKQGADVVALEPDPENAEELRNNLELNGVDDNVRILQKGLWKEETSLNFGNEGKGSKVTNEGETKIDTTTIDQLEEKIGCFDFVKMDIEGAELEAIEGAEDCLSRGEAFFSIASYHRRKGSRTADFLKDIFQKKNFEVEDGHNIHFTTWAWRP